MRAAGLHPPALARSGRTRRGRCSFGVDPARVSNGTPPPPAPAPPAPKTSRERSAAVPALGGIVCTSEPPPPAPLCPPPMPTPPVPPPLKPPGAYMQSATPAYANASLFDPRPPTSTYSQGSRPARLEWRPGDHSGAAGQRRDARSHSLSVASNSWRRSRDRNAMKPVTISAQTTPHGAAGFGHRQSRVQVRKSVVGTNADCGQ
jgi:hypothetical protein